MIFSRSLSSRVELAPFNGKDTILTAISFGRVPLVIEAQSMPFGVHAIEPEPIKSAGTRCESGQAMHIEKVEIPAVGNRKG